MKFKNLIGILLLLFLSMHVHAKELRIVSLAPNLTEIVYALGLGKNLVGNTVQCDYPKEAALVYKVGDYIRPSLERILALHPSVVLATEGNPQSLLSFLRAQQVVVVATNPQSSDELKISILEIGKALGAEKQAQLLAEQMGRAVRRLASHPPTQRSFLLALQFDPIYAVAPNTWLGELFQLAGYRNVVPVGPVRYPVLSHEFLFLHPPELVLVGNLFGKTEAESLAWQKERLSRLFTPEQMQRVQVVVMPKDILMRPGPRLIEGIRFIESLAF